MIKNNDGIITVKLVLIIVSMITVFSVLLQGLTIGFNSNHDLRNKKILSDHVLADYDTYLYVNYGLYGVRKVSGNAIFKHSLAKQKTYEPLLINDLQQTDVMYHQVEKLMLVRLPVNYADQLLSKLDIIKKAKQTKDDIELKTIVDTALSDLGHVFDKRILLCQQINRLTDEKIKALIIDQSAIRHQLENIQKTYQELLVYVGEIKNEMNRLQFKLPSGTAKEKLVIRQAIVSLQLKQKKSFSELEDLNDLAKNLVNQYEHFINTIESYKLYNQSLIEVLISVANKTKQVETLIDNTRRLIEYNQEGIEVVKNYLLESMEKSRDQLYVDRFGEHVLDLQFVNYITNRNLNIETKWYPVIQIPYKNKMLIESIDLKLFRSDLKDYLNNSEELLNDHLESLILYEQVTVFPGQNSTSEYEDYYDDQRKIENKEIEVTENIKIDQSVTYSEMEKGEFWKVVFLDLAETIKISVVTNEYILSTFKSYAAPSLSDYDYFDKYNRASYFIKGEIEYILMGESSESVNVMETSGLILGVRTVMNGIHIYTDTEKLSLSESIGVSVAGWTGFGAPLVSNVLRICWAMGESFYDMSELIKGEGVPFYKMYPDQWHFDLGIVYEQKTLPKYLDLIELTYHDYLRFMLLTLSNETKLKRIINLIELNLYQANRALDLSTYYTTVEIEDFQRGFYE